MGGYPGQEGQALRPCCGVLRSAQAQALAFCPGSTGDALRWPRARRAVSRLGCCPPPPGLGIHPRALCLRACHPRTWHGGCRIPQYYRRLGYPGRCQGSSIHAGRRASSPEGPRGPSWSPLMSWVPDTHLSCSHSRGNETKRHHPRGRRAGTNVTHSQQRDVAKGLDPVKRSHLQEVKRKHG